MLFPFNVGGSMQGPPRYCQNCGCRCHCLTTECMTCINDVCNNCDCELPIRDLPDSFTLENT